jgi:hypothetical protein
MQGKIKLPYEEKKPECDATKDVKDSLVKG